LRAVVEEAPRYGPQRRRVSTRSVSIAFSSRGRPSREQKHKLRWSGDVLPCRLCEKRMPQADLFTPERSQRGVEDQESTKERGKRRCFRRRSKTRKLGSNELPPQPTELVRRALGMAGESRAPPQPPPFALLGFTERSSRAAPVSRRLVLPRRSPPPPSLPALRSAPAAGRFPPPPAGKRTARRRGRLPSGGRSRGSIGTVS
jgi:hypothetical protein